MRLGADRQGDALHIALDATQPWSGRLHFDYARHRRVLNFSHNYVRLNEWPEWYVVDENTLYSVTDAKGSVQELLGSDLKNGMQIRAPSRLTVRPQRPRAVPEREESRYSYRAQTRLEAAHRGTR